MVRAIRPGGDVLDLQVIRPNPTVEVGGQVVCEIDGEPLFRMADAATAAVDDHDVREHYANGADLIDAFAGKKRQLPTSILPSLLVLTQPCLVRERCRLRR